MQNREFNLVASDGTFLVGRFWKPSGYPAAVICLVHGIGEHSGRYHSWAQKFCNDGFMVYSVDLRGHGLSEGKRGHIDHLSNYLDDINSLVRRVKHNWDDIPIFIYGHSMGGNLVLNFLLRKRQDFSGAIITSPWLKLVHPPSPIVLKLAETLDKIFPKLIFHTGIKSTQLTSDTNEQETSDNDSLMHGRISLRLFNELHKSAEELIERSSRIVIPVFFAHGTRDEITDIETTRNLADKLGETATFYDAQDAKHEIHREPVSDKLFESVTCWIDLVLKRVEHAI
ncbi:alpha/beta hydrolase [Marinilabilia rubra]|uniref:Alpha/beta hydrolase n=1 Tax=Marinilabilia rubra TaxID=2162893 RepID=A0A2U2B800_9BACT|nr:alpha/beta hydrolase [Marinilabilia rubra]PWD99211.1 alpha/beta hydrolase [Marinilabilia rubra]